MVSYAADTRNICHVLKSRSDTSSHKQYVTALCTNEKYIKRLEYYNLVGHAGCVNTVSWNSGGTLIVSGSDDQKLKIWEPFSKKLIRTIKTPHRGNIFCAKFMPGSNDQTIVSCAREPNIYVFDLSRPTNPLQQKYTCHSDVVHKLSIEPGSTSVFISCSSDGTARQFDIREKDINHIVADLRRARSTVGSFRRPSCIPLNSVDFNPVNPNYFIIGGDDPYIRLYDRRSSSTICVQKYSPESIVNNYNPDRPYSSCHITGVRHNVLGTEIIGTWSGDNIYLFDVEPAKFASPRVTSTPPPSSSSMDESADDDQEDDGEWEDVPEEQQSNVSGESADYVSQYKVCCKGHVNVRTVKEVQFLGPRSEYIAAGSDCGNIFIYNSKNAEIVNVMKGDRDVVNCIDPHPSCKLSFVSSGIDSDCKVWQPTLDEDKIKGPESWAHVLEENASEATDRNAFVLTPNMLIQYLMNQEAGDSDQEGEVDDPQRDRRATLARVARLLSQANWNQEDEDEDEQVGEEDQEEEQEGRPQCRTM
ncbi:hypothetical protein AKO1_007771 [Acrasis kona]|uniref:Uncharacterized protein n=1 Tax=Acrasis kona TaxID=1008807 RepID=A0AAW2YQ09_9EUKA